MEGTESNKPPAYQVLSMSVFFAPLAPLSILFWGKCTFTC